MNEMIHFIFRKDKPSIPPLDTIKSASILRAFLAELWYDCNNNVPMNRYVTISRKKKKKKRVEMSGVLKREIWYNSVTISSFKWNSKELFILVVEMATSVFDAVKLTASPKELESFINTFAKTQIDFKQLDLDPDLAVKSIW